MSMKDALDVLYALVTLLVALSLASERLVEIVKGMSSFLNTENPDAGKERLRRLSLHLLAVAAGILTALLAGAAFPNAAQSQNIDRFWGTLVLGLLASGGSSFWNSILTYLLKVKDIKEAESAQKRSQVRAAGDPQAQREVTSGSS